MNRRFAATLELQRPDYRDQASLVGLDVCPHCKCETDVYAVFCDGHVFETHRCREHGDVCPMRSHIVNSTCARRSQ